MADIPQNNATPDRAESIAFARSITWIKIDAMQKQNGCLEKFSEVS
jgi:hypothetical protein